MAKDFPAGTGGGPEGDGDGDFERVEEDLLSRTAPISMAAPIPATTAASVAFIPPELSLFSLVSELSLLSLVKPKNSSRGARTMRPGGRVDSVPSCAAE